MYWLHWCQWVSAGVTWVCVFVAFLLTPSSWWKLTFNGVAAAWSGCFNKAGTWHPDHSTWDQSGRGVATSRWKAVTIAEALRWSRAHAGDESALRVSAASLCLCSFSSFAHLFWQRWWIPPSVLLRHNQSDLGVSRASRSFMYLQAACSRPHWAHPNTFVKNNPSDSAKSYFPVKVFFLHHLLHVRILVQFIKLHSWKAFYFIFFPVIKLHDSC